MERDVEAVPAVDRHDGQRELGQLGLAELLPRRCVRGIGYLLMLQSGHRLSPCQRRALAIAVEMRRFAPSADLLAALLGLAARLPIFRVHIQTKGTTAELRDPVIDHINQLRLRPRLSDRHAQCQRGSI
jgi:hypothetical protein